ncbi:MAG: amidohydrolase [Syntrophales bacterium]
MNDTDRKLDLLITGGTLLAMEGPARIVEEPMIGIRDGKVLFVEEGPRATGAYPAADERIDAAGCLVMPGLVNTHTHIPMVLFRGFADDLPLMKWLNDCIFPAEKRFINRDTVYAASMLAIAEMILSGTTTFCDGYFFEGAVARAAIDCGMRGVLAEGFIDSPHSDPPDTSRHREDAERFIGEWQDRSPLITPSLICHSPYTCSPATLQTIKAAATDAATTFQIHLSETREEVALLYAKYGKKPVQHLNDLGLLDQRTIAAHCIWLADDELDIIAASGAKVAHDPESNMKLGAGVSPLPGMLNRGIDVGLGTDGCASNNNLDLFGEMGMCAKLHKVFSADPTLLPAERVVAMATLGGARVLGMADRIGSIVPGKCADIILLDLKKPHLTPLYHPFSQLVYAVSGSDVSTSIIGGKIVMRDRSLLTIDIDTVMAEVRNIARSIGRNRATAIRSRTEAPLPRASVAGTGRIRIPSGIADEIGKRQYEEEGS